MNRKAFTTTGKVWVYPDPNGGTGWHFVHVDKKVSDAIKEATKLKKKGFGSVKVEVTIGKSIWQTSLFPSARDGVYLLPIKADIRKQECIFEGDIISVNITLL